MSGGIYVLRGDDEIVELRERPYEAEEVLQTLVAKYPSLLAGDQYLDQEPRRWLLVSREASLPDSEDGAGRWSVDHLFVDQDAIPTLVEVKRRSDTRIRREVVGQMLDYAANGVVYWPVDQLREMFARQCQRDALDADLAVSRLCENSMDVEEFWERAGENLRVGRIRMVFLADQIPRELGRVVEFLNGQMSPAEVIAIEVKQFVGSGDLKTLVPRVIGQSAEIEVRKGQRRSASRSWDWQSVSAALLDRCGKKEAETARRLQEWAHSRGWRSTFGKGQHDGSWIPVVEVDGLQHYPIVVYTYGRVEIQFQHLKPRPPFDDQSVRLELLELVNRIPGVRLGPDVITRRPSIPLELLARDESAMDALLAALQWVEDKVRSSADRR